MKTIDRIVNAFRASELDCAYWGEDTLRELATIAHDVVASERRALPWWKRWVAHLFSDRVRELENEAGYFRSIVKGEFDKINLVDLSLGAEGLKMAIKSVGFAGLLSEFMVQSLKSVEAKNFVEISATHKNLGPLTFTVQRQEGETPGSKASRLEAELEMTKKELTMYKPRGEGLRCEGCGSRDHVRRSIDFDLCPDCEAGLRAEYKAFASRPTSRDYACPVPEKADV